MPIKFAGQEYSIEQRVPDSQLQLKHIASGTLSMKSEHEIVRPMSSAEGEMLASTYKKDEARYGKRVTDLGQRANETALSTTRPLARVQIDVTKLDLFVADEKTNLLIGRPWLVINICALTKMIIGFYLSSSKTVHGSLTNQI